ncbi:MAG: ferrous iron transport protein A [Desulfurococcales archaeon]|nr:ferrous iron transport protein A [Desulfurococcales archaeon]
MYWQSDSYYANWFSWGRGRGRKGWGRGSIIGPAPPQVIPYQPPQGTISLERVPSGSKVKIVAILAGYGASSRAYQMGLAPGTIVEVVENNLLYPWTPIIVNVHGLQVAIGRGLASKIFVEILEQPTTQSASGTSQQKKQDQ